MAGLASKTRISGFPEPGGGLRRSSDFPFRTIAQLDCPTLPRPVGGQLFDLAAGPLRLHQKEAEEEPKGKEKEGGSRKR